jgi:glycerol-1-phosphate dehydrogenase [NAD(P)+]
MSKAILDRLLAGRFEDSDGGPSLSVGTPVVAIGAGVADDAAERVKALELGGRLAVVFDDITAGVLGERVARALRSIAAVETIDLGAKPYADDNTVGWLREASAQSDALIAVGSGTINDLCKASARADNKPYAVFGTAASMNGYTSVTAAITVGGLKKTVPGIAARGVFLDLDVLAAAPARMTRAGLGDSLCRATCQTDWRLAQAICAVPYREAPFALLAEDEPGLFGEPEALVSGERTAMARLARTLVLSGFGMAICTGSEPASEGEHLIAHYGDMLHSPDTRHPLHGEVVGVTTLTMARLHASLLAKPPRVAPSAVSEADVMARFGPALGALCWEQFAPKRLDRAAADALNERLAAEWEVIAARLGEVHMPASTLEDVLRRAGAPTRPEEIGWPAAFYRDAVMHAREIRNRYTALDLAGDAGRLGEAMDD